MTTEPKDRWHTPMTTDISKLEDFGTPDLPMGDYEGDHPPAPHRKDDEVGTPTLEETLENYDNSRPHPLTITNHNA